MNDTVHFTIISLIVTGLVTLLAKALEGSQLLKRTREEGKAGLTVEAGTRLDKAYARIDALEAGRAAADTRHALDTYAMSRIAADLSRLEGDVYSVIDDLRELCEEDAEKAALSLKVQFVAEQFRRIAEKARPIGDSEGAPPGSGVIT